MDFKIAGNLFPKKNDIVPERVNQFFCWVNDLSKYRRVYILANSNEPEIKLPPSNDNDLVIVFNRFNLEHLERHCGDVVVIQRQAKNFKAFHCHSERLLRKEGKVKYFALSDYYIYINIDNVDFLQNYDAIFCADFIPYSSHEGKIPSSGYVLLYILNHYFQQSPFIRNIHPIGFQFSGLSMHDWDYEKEQSKSHAYGYNNPN